MKALVYYGFVMLFTLSAFTGSTGASIAACAGSKLVVLGDSLVAGYGLGPGEAYPEKLATVLKDELHGLEVINAGVSGDTTSGGLARLDWSVPKDAKAVILELGANDALRGISVERTRQNLDQIITSLKARDVEVLLVGMMAPPNMGEEYGAEFNPIYADLAQKHDIMLYPFFLDGVAADPSLNQADGIHPTAQGIDVIIEKTSPTIRKFLKSACG